MIEIAGSATAKSQILSIALPINLVMARVRMGGLSIVRDLIVIIPIDSEVIMG
jgi:hypothetical protein